MRGRDESAMERCGARRRISLWRGRWPAASSAATQLLGAEAPDFVLKSVSGKNLRLSEYRGEVVMLSFWATWCGDCRAQLDELGEMRDRYQDAGVELLAVSLDQNARQAGERDGATRAIPCCTTLAARSAGSTT